MGIQHSKSSPTGGEVSKSASDDKALRTCTAAAFRAVDVRNINKLRKALSVGAAVGNVRRTSGTRGNIPSALRSMTLLEYAVEKSFLPGIELMLKLMPTSDPQHDAPAVTAAFMRSCDGGYLRLSIFNLFVDAAIDGHIQLDLESIYRQLVDHYMYRKPYDLARRSYFDIISLNDGTCRITPIGLAVIHDDAEAIESFAKRGADVNSYDRDGNTALLRAGYSLKRTCFHKLLLLGADPNKRSCKRGGSPSSMSPLISVCVAYGQPSRSRTPLIADLIASGADPSSDRCWFAGAGATPGVGAGPPSHCVARRLDETTRRALAEMCTGPRRLLILCASVVRRCLAAAEVNGVVKNTDTLPLPSSVKAMLKLEITEL